MKIKPIMPWRRGDGGGRRWRSGRATVEWAKMLNKPSKIIETNGFWRPTRK